MAFGACSERSGQTSITSHQEDLAFDLSELGLIFAAMVDGEH